MLEVVADIEADNLLHKVTVIHSLVIRVVSTGELFSCADQPGYLSIKDGLEILEAADWVIGHNFLQYDRKVIKKIRGLDIPENKILDTLVLGRKYWPNLGGFDDQLILEGSMPPLMKNKHSLEAWGFRTGHHKGAFGKNADWSVWTPEMQTYCEQDTDTNLALYNLILAQIESMVEATE